MNILLCEDEARIADFIQQGLREEEHTVTWKANGTDTLQDALENQYDVIILDIRLPDISGIEVCRSIRLHHPHLPILMLTALDAIEDRVAGLRAGADDYLPKPFAFAELLARLDALHRRAHTEGVGKLQYAGLAIDPIEKKGYYLQQEVTLTSRQFELLAYFVARPEKVLSREAIYRDVWELPFEPNTNVIDVYVNYVRQALKSVAFKGKIASIRGVGYQLIAS